MIPSEQPASDSGAACSRGERSVLDWPARAGAADAVLAELEVCARRSRRRWRAAGAATVALLTIGLVWQTGLREPVPAPVPLAASAAAPASPIVSQPERQLLPDGSIVELKPGGQVEVAFTDAIRRVTLVRGEAHFQVAKNPRRPFVVSAGAVTVRAVGTAFSVQLGGRAVEVLVTEGRVAVASSPPRTVPPASAADPHANATITAEAEPTSPAAFVDAGSLAVVAVAPLTEPSRTPQVVAVSAIELGERLSWRVPRLELSGTPLAEALPIFNRHSRAQLALEDPALGRLKLSGILRADNTDALLRLLKLESGVVAERRGENEFVLRKIP